MNLKFRKKEPAHVAVLTSEQTITFCLRRNGQLLCTSVPSFERPIEDIQKDIRAFLAQNNLERISLTISIPRQDVLARKASLPDVEFEQLQSMAVLQAPQLFPLSPAQMIVTCQPLNETQERLRSVEIYALPRTKIARTLEIFEPWKHSIRGMPLSTDLMSMLYRDQGLIPKDKGALFIDFWHQTIEFTGFHDGQLAFSRCVHLTETSPTTLVEEAAATANTFFKRSVANSNQVIICTGDPEAAATLVRELKPKYPFPIEKLPPDKSQSQVPTSLIGALDNSQACSTNFLPAELMSLQSGDVRKRQSVRLAVTTGASVLLLIGAVLCRYVDHALYLRKLHGQIAETEVRTKFIDAWLSRERAVADKLQVTCDPLRALRTLYSAIDSATAVKAIDYDADTGVTIYGSGNRLSDVTVLISGLQKTGLFKDVSLKSSDVQRSAQRTTVDFCIAGSFEPGHGRALP